MEPFFLRCETCQARLRVRDERFLGQIQSCPKCGSMVHILAPAGWLTANEATAEVAPEISEVVAAAPSSAGTGLGTWIQEHAILCASGATATVIACGLAAFLAFRGDERVAALSRPTPAVESAEIVAANDGVAVESNSDVASPAPATEISTEMIDDARAARAEAVANASASTSPEVEMSEQTTIAESSFLPLVSPPALSEPAPSSEPEAKAEEPRTLTLEPVAKETAPATIAASADPHPAYPPSIDASPADIRSAEAPPTNEMPVAASSDPVPLDPPARRTNVMDQLAVPIDSINLPEMPIGEFVGFMSGMAAVPIELDAKVLGEVGLSTRSTVIVHGDDTTVGKLLARVLKEHQLTCVDRDGTLVVVRAKR